MKLISKIIISLISLLGLISFALCFPIILLANPLEPMQVRALMIHPRKAEQLQYYYNLIDLAAKNNFNTIIIGSTPWINFPSIPLPNSQYNLEAQDIIGLVAYAKSKKMEVIPHVNLLTHQEEVMKKYNSNLMLNETDSDPIDPRTWEIEKKLIDDTIAMFHPTMIHIGHDELRGYDNDFKTNMKKYMKRYKYVSPQSYIDHIKKVHDYLKSQNINTLLWGDMLLDQEKFSKYYGGRTVHGTKDFDILINQLPKDIIICDWHYFQSGTTFPSYDYFQSKGFKVWGATWDDPTNIKLFSSYVRIRATNNEGMIATTWHYSFDIKFASKARQIIIESGKYFYAQ